MEDIPPPLAESNKTFASKLHICYAPCSQTDNFYAF